MFKDLSDNEFLELIFTSEDRLGLDYVEEAKKRRQTIVPLLCDVLIEEENYEFEDEAWWCVVHAVLILGILSDIRSIEALLAASKFSITYHVDWIWEALPECYLRLGPACIPMLKDHIDSSKSIGFEEVSGEIQGLSLPKTHRRAGRKENTAGNFGSSIEWHQGCCPFAARVSTESS